MILVRGRPPTVFRGVLRLVTGTLFLGAGIQEMASDSLIIRVVGMFGLLVALTLTADAAVQIVAVNISHAQQRYEDAMAQRAQRDIDTMKAKMRRATSERKRFTVVDNPGKADDEREANDR